MTVAEPNRAKAASYVDAKTITSGPIRIITAGDSLTRTYTANSADQAGWGQVLGQFLTSDAAVDNTLSNGGRSSRSFYNEIGRWNQVKLRLTAAQTAAVPAFVFIMFGHNDQKKVTDTDGPDYLTFADHNQNGTVAGTYYDYLERYIVETRELGGIPILFTPFVREYLEGAPSTVTIAGQHNITVPYAGETAARGDYPAAAKAIAAKHDVPIVDITSWSKTMVEAHAAAGSLPYVYISGDQTHVRNLGALLMAEEAVRALNAQGILTGYAKPSTPRLMMDTSTHCLRRHLFGQHARQVVPAQLVQGRVGDDHHHRAGQLRRLDQRHRLRPVGDDHLRPVLRRQHGVGPVRADRFGRLQRRADRRAHQPHARLRKHGAERQTRRDRADRQRQGGHQRHPGDGDLADVFGDGHRARRDHRGRDQRDHRRC